MAEPDIGPQFCYISNSVSPSRGCVLSSEHVERRLAAIMAVDVAGSCRLIGIDEEGTLAQLKALRKTLFDPKIAQHHGRIVKNTGDGALVEFASVVDAVRCADDVQRGVAEQNTDVPQDKRIEFRIGIHLGDIIIADDDIFGDGVNIAVRLEGIAEPGGICISDDAHRQVRGKVESTLEDMGAQTLKNIAEPMRAWRVRIGPSSSPATKTPTETAQPLALPDKPSIAVLPFENMSGDPEQEYFADGMVEEIITALSRFKWLFVIARNSSFTFKGRAVDIKEVGRRLGVRYVLEGSVRKASGKVRITGQLIDAVTGAHIWVDRFERDLTDVFALLLRPLPPFYLTTREGLAEAMRLAHRALELDPGLASAARLAGACHNANVLLGYSNDPQFDRKEAVRLARLALSIDNSDPETLARASQTSAWMVGDSEGGIEMVDRAVALN